MNKTKRARYTLEFKLEAVRLVKAGQSVTAVAATLDVPAQSISNWVKAAREGKLGGADTKPVSPEQMALSRLRAEVARLKMERDIPKKGRCAFREGLDVKYAFIERNRRHWPISVLCEVLGVSPSGFHQRRQRAAQGKPQRSRLGDDAPVIIGLFSRQVVGWSMQPHRKAELVTDALRMAWFRRRRDWESDRGSQYCIRLTAANLTELA